MEYYFVMYIILLYLFRRYIIYFVVCLNNSIFIIYFAFNSMYQNKHLKYYEIYIYSLIIYVVV